MTLPILRTVASAWPISTSSSSAPSLSMTPVSVRLAAAPYLWPTITTVINTTHHPSLLAPEAFVLLGHFPLCIPPTLGVRTLPCVQALLLIGMPISLLSGSSPESIWDIYNTTTHHIYSHYTTTYTISIALLNTPSSILPLLMLSYFNTAISNNGYYFSA